MKICGKLPTKYETILKKTINKTTKQTYFWKIKLFIEQPKITNSYENGDFQDGNLLLNKIYAHQVLYNHYPM